MAIASPIPKDLELVVSSMQGVVNSSLRTVSIKIFKPLGIMVLDGIVSGEEMNLRIINVTIVVSIVVAVYFVSDVENYEVTQVISISLILIPAGTVTPSSHEVSTLSS